MSYPQRQHPFHPLPARLLPFWSDYEIDAHLFDDFLDDWLIKQIFELRV
jgi:hypothetical protein